MSAIIVDGNALAREIRTEVSDALAELADAGHPPPCVAIVQIGDDPAAAMYTRRLQRTFGDASMRVEVRQLSAETTAADAVATVAALSADPDVHGIQIQTPTPPEVPLARLLDALDPRKDLDGIHPYNAGLLAQGRPAI